MGLSGNHGSGPRPIPECVTYVSFSPGCPLDRRGVLARGRQSGQVDYLHYQSAAQSGECERTCLLGQQFDAYSSQNLPKSLKRAAETSLNKKSLGSKTWRWWQRVQLSNRGSRSNSK